jgi:outer membrane protein OmpA-like peptidoglycan-associated protein
VLLLSACGSTRYLGSNEQQNLKPSLRKAQSRQIVQVAANFEPTTRHDTPYFIVCFDEECPKLTVKTPLNSIALNTGDNANPAPQVTAPGHFKRSDSYFKKTTEVLERYRTHFDYASAELNEHDIQLLGDFVKSYPQNQSIIITGFTDNDSKPDGKIGNHWLALERALSVKNKLIALGYPETQILLEAKFLCCYIDSNESEAGRRNNRRAEISLIHVLHQ